jgi:hypothetical protein
MIIIVLAVVAAVATLHLALPTLAAFCERYVPETNCPSSSNCDQPSPVLMKAAVI